MKFIPKQELFEARQFNDETEVRDIAAFIRGDDNRMAGTVYIGRDSIRAVIHTDPHSMGDESVSINGGEWVIRSSAGIEILTPEQMAEKYIGIYPR